MSSEAGGVTSTGRSIPNGQDDSAAVETSGRGTQQSASKENVAAVFLLARQGSFEEALQVLAEHPDLWQEVEEGGYTLLHWAALSGHLPFISRALSMGLQVDSVAENGQTALMWAVTRGQVAAVKALIDAQADVHKRDSLGATAFIIAVQHRQHTILLLLICRASRDRLFAEVDTNGCGPVHWASYKGDQTSLKLLDYFDADFEVQDNQGMTPLHRAVQASSSMVIEFLVEDKRLDISQADSKGRTCLAIALEQDDKMMHRKLSLLQQDGGEKQDLLDGRQPRLNKSKERAKFQTRMRDNGPCTFWLVSVSLAVFQYLSYIRPIAWRDAPMVALAFELGVPISLALFFSVGWMDPGKVPARLKSVSGVEDIMRALTSGGEVPDFSRLCTTTWVLKGPRTKYCTHTEACVEEFDHFCGWLNTAIGRGNHRPFIFLAIIETCTQFCNIYLLYVVACDMVKTETIWSWISGVAYADPFLVFMVCVHGFTAPMVSMLTLQQLRLIGINMTTNELINANRYEHFWEEVKNEAGGTKKVFRNPFHKGNVIRNCLDFWWTRRRADRGPQSAGFLFGRGKRPEVQILGPDEEV
mmetsp:Transcript_5858/g.11825  ORF Transcript_5858/g.11825 Transcript_5858/m.11825 type:complete len:585 (-) Transcript_5858:105-1859(-)